MAFDTPIFSAGQSIFHALKRLTQPTAFFPKKLIIFNVFYRNKVATIQEY
jgi:hypothetical protein